MKLSRCVFIILCLIILGGVFSSFAAEIQGIVIDGKGNPVSESEAVLISIDLEYMEYQLVVGDTFTFLDVPPGKYMVHTWKGTPPNYSDIVEDTWSLELKEEGKILKIEVRLISPIKTKDLSKAD